MNQRERFLKTVAHEEPDRAQILYLGFIGNSFNEWLDKYEEDLEDEDILIDPMFGDRTPRQWLNDDFVFFSVHGPQGYTSMKTTIDGKEGYSIDAYGKISYQGKNYAGKPYTWYVGPYFDSLEKRENFYAEHGKPWDEKYLPKEKAFKEYRKKIEYLEKNDFPWMPLSPSGSMWEHIFEGLGPGLVARLMRKDPQNMHRIIEENLKPIKYCQKRMLEEGAHVVGLYDDMGQKGRALVSPKNFDRFLRPHYQELVDMAHKAGAHFFLHSCGNITALLPSLVEIGVDIWQTVEPASLIDFADVVDRFGDKITFAGGICASAILPFEPLEKVKAHIMDQLKTGLPNGGYIPGPSHDLMDVPVERIALMRDMIAKYAEYPLKFP